FLQYILDLHFKLFELPEDVQLFFKALQQPFISATFDYMYIKSYSFRLFSSLPCVLTPVRGESLKILNLFDVSLPVSHLLWSSQSFGHQKAINGFDMPLPVAVCFWASQCFSSTLWCIDHHIVLDKLSTINGCEKSLPKPFALD
ncbi:hypothetical protein Tco_1269903, partial [Tanacetum coccineum]